jgi:hypothetical protein
MSIFRIKEKAKPVILTKQVATKISVLPTAAARVLSRGLVKWDLWWIKWRWGRFSPSTSVSPANLQSTNCSAITLTYHLGLVQYARSGRSTRDLVPPTSNKKIIMPHGVATRTIKLFIIYAVITSKLTYLLKS